MAEGDDLAAALASRPVASGTRCWPSTPAGLGKALSTEEPGYLVVFGMDAGGSRLPADRLRELLRDGPGRGVHLLSWWRGVRRFTEDTGGSAAREDVAGLVFLNVPATDVSLLIGQPVDWQPRPNRALLHDRHTDRTTVFVPFVRPDPALAAESGGIASAAESGGPAS